MVNDFIRKCLGLVVDTSLISLHVARKLDRIAELRGYLLRDRDASYGQDFRDRVEAMGIEEVVTAPRSPWQKPYVERVVGSIRRECLNHVIILDERHLRRALSSYFQYYHESRTHLSLDKDCPEPRPIHPPTAGKIIAFPEVGGLHHRYERRAA
jgi:putative transposase